MSLEKCSKLVTLMTDAMGPFPNLYARAYAKTNAAKLLPLLAEIEPADLAEALAYIRADDITCAPEFRNFGPNIPPTRL